MAVSEYQIPGLNDGDPGDPQGPAGMAQGAPKPFGWAAREAAANQSPPVIAQTYGSTATHAGTPQYGGYAAPSGSPYAPPTVNPYVAPQPQTGTTQHYGTPQPQTGTPQPYGSPGPVAPPPWGTPTRPPKKRKTVLIIVLVIILGVFGAGVVLIASGAGKEQREPRSLLDGDVDRLSSGLQTSVVSVGGKACSYVATGSGFFVSHDLVVTNAHVVAGMKEPEVFTNSDSSFSAKAVAFDPDNDVAILKIDSPDRIPVPLADYEPPVGEGIVALGFPEAGPYHASPGTVTMVLNAQGESIYGQTTSRQKHIVLDIQVRPGNSGGPVVDRDGVVVGIVTAKSVISKTNGIAVPASTIRRDLEKAKSAGFPTVGTGSCMAI